MTMPRFSVLDLSPILEGETPREALQHTVALARHVEALGFHRFWLAEHHNLAGIASAATAVVIGHVAGATSTIRVGAGGIMLPNHPPLVIAEQFGTLDALYPGRIDLGLGRAPGGDGMVLRALRRRPEEADKFPRDVQELQFFLREARDGQTLRAVPGAGANVPLFLLGSSTFSAELAAALGLPFAFAAHFAPDALGAALSLYRAGFEPSAALERPYVMVGLNVVAADSDAEAQRLFTSLQRAFAALRRNAPGRLPPPVADVAEIGSERERASVDHMLRLSVVGGPERVRHGLQTLIEATGADEIVVTAQVWDQAARRRSFEIVAEVRDTLASRRRAA